MTLTTTSVTPGGQSVSTVTGNIAGRRLCHGRAQTLTRVLARPVMTQRVEWPAMVQTRL